MAGDKGEGAGQGDCGSECWLVTKPSHTTLKLYLVVPKPGLTSSESWRMGQEPQAKFSSDPTPTMHQQRGLVGQGQEEMTLAMDLEL